MNWITLLKRFWAALMLPSALLGIWFFPSDWSQSGSKDVVAPWRGVLAMLDRETMLWALTLFLSGWAIWSEVRPYVLHRIKAWRSKPERPLAITVHTYAPCWAVRLDIVDDGEPPREYGGSARAIMYYIQVRNSRDDGKTLRNLKAKYYSSIDLVPIPFEINGNQVLDIDLQHGDWANIQLGFIIEDSPKVMESLTYRQPVNSTKIENFRKLATSSWRTFERPIGGGNVITTIQDGEPFRYIVALTADDTPSTQVCIYLDLYNIHPDKRVGVDWVRSANH